MGSTVEDMFRYYTNRAGELSRNLALVGVGIIWLLHGKVSGENNELLTELDGSLTFALLFIFASLVLDILQYCIGIYQWRIEFEANSLAKAKYKITPINTAVGFIYVKLASLVMAYVLILVFIIRTPMI